MTRYDNNKTIRIAVGSLNEAKLMSVKKVGEKLFGGNVEVVGYETSSNVSCQPMSDSESIEGATNRAKNVLKLDENADYGVGIEGGVHKIESKWFECGWIVVFDRYGKFGIGSSARFELSPSIMERIIMKGEELATIIDDLTGRVNVRGNDGAMGVITNGMLKRDEAYSHGVMFAFAPFISSPIFWK
jgi:inosine/xanthosine triphosphatase